MVELANPKPMDPAAIHEQAEKHGPTGIPHGKAQPSKCEMDARTRDVEIVRRDVFVRSYVRFRKILCSQESIDEATTEAKFAAEAYEEYLKRGGRHPD